MRHIAFITTSRADFGHLHWPLRAIEAHPGLRASLVVAGAHLSPEYGATVADIEAQGFTVSERVECLLSSDSGVGMAKTIGLATLGLADALARLGPDLLFIPADRYEMLAAGAVALALGIPIAHLEGGEVSAGAIDDAVRNALSKLSHLHLAPTASAAGRLLALGEERWRIHQVGAPSLDHLRHREPMSRDEVARRLGTALCPDYLLVAFHPVTLLEKTRAESAALFAALARLDRQVFFCFPNADAGSHAIVAAAEAYCATRSDARLFINLEHWLYWNLLRHAGLLLGNSSSGIMEAPSLQVPVVNIGDRQEGRERAANIIDAPAEADAILAAVAQSGDARFQQALAKTVNPYGDGHASERIVAALAAAPEKDVLLSKRAPEPQPWPEQWPEQWPEPEAMSD